MNESAPPLLAGTGMLDTPEYNTKLLQLATTSREIYQTNQIGLAKILLARTIL
jgi:hypothetical protein